MEKKVVMRADGRYVIFYSFDAPMPDVQTSGNDADGSEDAAAKKNARQPDGLGRDDFTPSLESGNSRRERQGDQRV